MAVQISDESTGSIEDLLDKARQESDKERDKEEKKSPPAPRSRRSSKASLKEPLTAMYGTIGAAILPFSPKDGILILENAEDCAEALDALGKQNPKVRKVLERMVTGSAVGAVITAHAPILIGILKNHDLLPKFPGEKVTDGSKDESPTVSPVASTNGNPADYVAPTGPLTPIIMEAG